MLICVFSYEYMHMYTIIHIYQCTTHTIWYTDENIPHTFYILLIFLKSIFKTEKCLNTDAVLLKLFTPQTNTQRIFIAVHVLRSFK